MNPFAKRIARLERRFYERESWDLTRRKTARLWAAAFLGPTHPIRSISEDGSIALEPVPEEKCRALHASSLALYERIYGPWPEDVERSV